MEFLKDPLEDRFVPEVPTPVHQSKPLPEAILFPGKGQQQGIPDWKVVREYLAREGTFSKQHVMKILKESVAHMSKEPNLVRVPEPVVVVGDIHGQYYDLLTLLGMNAPPTNDTIGRTSNQNFLFLGDYVDRGVNGIEVVLLLLSIKLCHGSRIFLLRGNHETRTMTESFTFRKEVLAKYDEETYEAFMEVFDSMPIAALVGQRYLAVHGGLSPALTKLEDIDKPIRMKEPPFEGLLCDLMWADPCPDDEAHLMGEFTHNTERDCSVFFGKQAANKFLEANGLISVLRGHQVQQEGYKMHRFGDRRLSTASKGGNQTSSALDFPSVVTIFSAPNYCGSYDNRGAFFLLDHGVVQMNQFNEVEGPYKLPQGLNVFSWSAPFLADRVVNMFYNIISQAASVSTKSRTTRDKEREYPDDISIEGKNQITNLLDEVARVKALAEEKKKAKEVKGELMRRKVQAMGRLGKMYTTLREEAEFVLKIKNMAPDGKIPRGLLLEGKPAIRHAAKSFQLAKKLDRDNERVPKAAAAMPQQPPSGAGQRKGVNILLAGAKKGLV